MPARCRRKRRGRAMTIAKRVAMQKDTELVLLVNTDTGELLMERARFNHPLLPRQVPVRHFYTEILCKLSVAGKIREALSHTGVNVKGVEGKCLRITEDLVSQLIALLHLGLDDLEGDVPAFLKSLSTKWRKEEIGEILILKTPAVFV